MTREEITRMAREAGIVVTGEAVWKLCELVADAEAKRMHDEGFVTVGHMRQQIAAEREAILQMSAATWFKTQADYDAAIRTRGQS
jgi:hypothetical protein